MTWPLGQGLKAPLMPCVMFKNGVIYNSDFRNSTEPTVGLTISDPPYNQKYHYSVFKDNLANDEYLSLLSAAFRGKRCVIIHYPEETINILSTLGKCQECVSWVYNSNTGKQSRLITWWNCRPDFRKVPQPYKNPKDKRIAKRIAEGKSNRLYDWWNINQVKNVSKKNNPHPCPMPIEIIRRIILTTALPNEVIIDPFMGSGTTALAAIDTGHRFAGWEIDPTYYDYSCKTIIKREQI